jgi:hypothetical protein
MADVTVEFGATDTGLEKTLKALQSETDQLKAKMRSTEMSVTEADQAMRKLSQNNALEKKLKDISSDSGLASAKIDALVLDLRKLDKAKDSVDSGGISFGKLTGAISGAYAAVLGFSEAFRFTADAIKKSSDLAETMNKVNVIFGNAAKSVLSFSDSAVTALGMTRQQALDAASTFAIFGKSAGLSGGSLVDFSTNLVKLATDFASFHNASPEETITAIGAALRGESEPIRKFGILLDDATLKAEAMKLGLYDGTGALDIQTKSLAAYNVILQQSKDAQGDFKNTSDSLSNQMKILSATFDEMKVSLGDGMQKPTLNIVSILNDQFIPAISGAIKYGKDFISFLTTAPSNATMTGKAVNLVSESLSGFNYYMAKAVNFVSPMDDLLIALTNKGKQAGEGQTAAADGINKTAEAAKGVAPKLTEASGELSKIGLQAAKAANEFSGFKNEAEDTGEKVSGAFNLTSDFKPVLDGINSGWENVNETVTQTSNLLDGNLSLSDSISGTTEKQVSGLGDLNKQLEVSSDLSKLILKLNTSIHDKEEATAKKQEEIIRLKTDEVNAQININNAIAAGNFQEAQALKNAESLRKTIEDLKKTGFGEGEATKMANEMARAARDAERVQKSLATKIGTDIKARQESEAIDPSGALMKRAQEQISKGAYAAAEATGAQIKTREQEAMIRGVGSQSDRRALSDIAKDYGLDTMGKTSTQMRDELYKIRTEGQGTSDKIKKGLETTQKRMGDGMKTEAGKKAVEKDKPMKLDEMVNSILKLIEKIEPKLPTAALSA